PASLATAQAAIQNSVALGNRDFYTSDSQWPVHDDFDGYSLVLTGTFDMSDHVQLKSITSYRSFEVSKATELDGTRFHILENVSEVPRTVPANFQLPDRPNVKDRIWTQEFNVSGDLFQSRLSYLVGVFYSDELGHDVEEMTREPPAT